MEEELSEGIISLFSLLGEMSQINKPHFLFYKSPMSLIEQCHVGWARETRNRPSVNYSSKSRAPSASSLAALLVQTL